MTLPPRLNEGPRMAIHIQATCEGEFRCPFFVEWQPPKSRLAEARQHVRETGHAVVITETRIQTIELEKT